MGRSKLVLGLVIVTSTAYGSLIPIDIVDILAGKSAAQHTLLTMASSGNSARESGCVAAGKFGSTIVGKQACPPSFGGGNEQPGKNRNNVYTAVDMGITSFANLQLVFEPNEPQLSTGKSITIEQLALTLWNPIDGKLLEAYRLEEPYVINESKLAAGKAGYGFRLHESAIASADALLGQKSTLRIGVAATASDATGGTESIFARWVQTEDDTPATTQTPEPATWAVPLLAGLLFMGLGRRPKNLNQ